MVFRQRNPGLWRPQMAPPPNAAVKVDWNHPLANALAGLWLFRDGSDAAGLVPPGTLGAGAGFVSSPYGAAVSVPGAGALTIPMSDRQLDSGPLTVWALAKYSTQGAVLAKDDNNNNHGWILGFFANAVRFDSIGSSNLRVDGGSVTSGNWYLICATVDAALSSSSNISVYLNGALVAGPTSGGSGHLGDLGYDLRIGGTTDGTYVGQVTLAGVARRALSAGEIAQLYAEPYAMLRPVARRPYAAPTAVETITLDKWYAPPAQPLITRPELIAY